MTCAHVSASEKGVAIADSESRPSARADGVAKCGGPNKLPSASPRSSVFFCDRFGRALVAMLRRMRSGGAEAPADARDASVSFGRERSGTLRPRADESESDEVLRARAATALSECS